MQHKQFRKIVARHTCALYRYELIDFGMYWMIKRWPLYDLGANPYIRLGKKAYVHRLWREYTG